MRGNLRPSTFDPRPSRYDIQLVNRQSAYRVDRRRLIGLARFVLSAENVAAAEVERSPSSATPGSPN